MTQPVENSTQQTEKKPVQKTLLSSVDTFETVMNQLGKFITNPFVLIIGVITTIFLVKGKQQGNDLLMENAQLKERLRMIESELIEVKRKFKKLKKHREESAHLDQPLDSQEYSIEYKAPDKLPLSVRNRRTLFLK